MIHIQLCTVSITKGVIISFSLSSLLSWFPFKTLITACVLSITYWHLNMRGHYNGWVSEELWLLLVHWSTFLTCPIFVQYNNSYINIGCHQGDYLLPPPCTRIHAYRPVQYVKYNIWNHPIGLVRSFLLCLLNNVFIVFFGKKILVILPVYFVDKNENVLC